MKIVTGTRKRAVKAWLWSHVAALAVRQQRHPVRAWRTLRAMVSRREATRDGRITRKYAVTAGRYFWDLHSPGFPSRAFDRYVERELAHAAAGAPHGREPLQSVAIAITRRCALRCEHCFEWDALNRPEVLSLDDLHTIVARFQDAGVGQVLLSGGEPLQRFNDLIAVVERARDESDFWIFTSGVGLTREKARALRTAGLTGVLISVDHWDPVEHDRFRGLDGTFEWVRRAAAAAVDAGLALAISACPTREFVTPENVARFGELARELGAGFVQFLEPRAVGHFAGRDVALADEHIAVLEHYYNDANHGSGHAEMPGVAYPGYVQRRYGCFGNGRRYMYVDTEGRAHPCPFCRNPVADVLHDGVDAARDALAGAGCEAFVSPEADNKELTMGRETA